MSGIRAFPALVPLRPDDDGADLLRRAETWWRQEWQGQSFMAIGIRDSALGPRTMQPLRQTIRNCPEPFLVDSGHYVQERGVAVARRALAHFGLDRL